MIVLDTNVVSELIRPAPHARVIDWVDAREASDLVITVITAAEVRAGIAQLPAGRRKDDIATRIESLLSETFAGAVLPFDVFATPYYAEIVAARRRAGTPISALDAQIAAICRQHQATLATRNVRDFTATGVELLDPWNRSPSD